MSFADILAEIPRLTAEQRAEVLRQMADVEVGPSASKGGSGYRTQRVQGRLVLVAPRVIQQSEVDAILDEFP